VLKDILFYIIFSSAFVSTVKLRGSFCKIACIRLDEKQNYKSRIWNFIWHTNFNFLVPSLFVYCWPWQIEDVYELEGLYSCFGYRSQTVPTTRTIATVPTSSIQSSHQDPFPGLVKDLWHEGGQTPPILAQHTQIHPRALHYFLNLCFNSTKTLLILLHR
jgi:hypothetical protein